MRHASQLLPLSPLCACDVRLLCVCCACAVRVLCVCCACAVRVLGVCWACAGRVLGVFRACAERVLGVCWACAGRVPGKCRADALRVALQVLCLCCVCRAGALCEPVCLSASASVWLFVVDLLSVFLCEDQVGATQFLILELKRNRDETLLLPTEVLPPANALHKVQRVH